MPTKRTLTRQYADLQARYETVVGERDEAVKGLASRKWVEQHLASSQPDVVARLTKERDEIARALRTTEDQLAAARRQLAARPAAASELRDATARELTREERAAAARVVHDRAQTPEDEQQLLNALGLDQEADR